MQHDIVQLCTFRLGERHLAVPVDDVREVLRTQDISSVPRTPRAVAGLSSLRGRIVLSIDLRARLGFDAETLAATASNVVVEYGDSLYTFLVDEIGDIIDVEPDDIGPVPRNVDSELRELLQGVLERKEGWTLILDVDRILDLDI